MEERRATCAPMEESRGTCGLTLDLTTPLTETVGNSELRTTSVASVCLDSTYEPSLSRDEREKLTYHGSRLGASASNRNPLICTIYFKNVIK